MAFNLDEGRPIYPQLMDEIRLRIVTEVYGAGDRVPSVRELAMEARVNVNTMQKALQELEREGLVFASRNAGRTVTDDVEKIRAVKKDMAQGELERFISYMKGLNFTEKEIRELIEELLK